MILCTSGDRVRHFMLTAYEMGFINGEYVFMDIELFIFKVILSFLFSVKNNRRSTYKGAVIIYRWGGGDLPVI